MNEITIPSDWEFKELGDLCDIKIGGTPARNNESYWDIQKVSNNLWVSIKDLNSNIIKRTEEHITDLGIKHSNAKLVMKGTLIMSFKLTIGKIAFAGANLYTNEAIAALEPRNSSKIEKYFLYYMIPFIEPERYCETAVKGKTLNMNKLRVIKIPLPKSLKEQQKIASILQSIDNTINKTKELIEKYKMIKRGLMQDLLTKGIDEQNNIRNEKTHAFKDSPLGRIPVEWEVQKLVSFAQDSSNSFVNGPFGSDLLISELQSEGIPVIYVRDVNPGFYERVSSAYVSEKKARELGFCDVQTGDVLVAKVGDPPCDAAPYLEARRAIVTQDVIRIRPAKDVDAHFLSNLINSVWGRKAVDMIALQGTRKRVSLTNFKCICLPKPSPSEQIRIAAILDALDTYIKAEETYQNKLKLLKTGLMQDLLTGKVRVKVEKCQENSHMWKNLS